MRKSIFILTVLAVALIASQAVAAWGPTTMYNALTSDVLKVTFDYQFNTATQDYTYTYTLLNATLADDIFAFSLAFPTGVNAGSFTNILTPAGWTAKPYDALSNQLSWFCSGTDDFLIAPQASASFGFNTVYSPAYSLDVRASAQDSLGYNGNTFGAPAVPEPGSIVGLMTGLASLAGFKLRRRA